MASTTVPLTETQEARLRAVDAALDGALRDVQRWLPEDGAAPLSPDQLAEEERRRYEAARARLRTLSQQRDALRARLVEERTIELRRQRLAAMVADQEVTRQEVARAAAERASSGGLGGVIRRVFGRR